MKPVDVKNDKINDRVAVIILAAGLGTRMKSDRAKVLHEINGIPMIRYVVETANALEAGEIIIVIGHQAAQVQTAVADHTRLKFAHQDRQLGTGHAVMCALPNISEQIEHVVVLCGDVPLLKPATVTHLMADHFIGGQGVTILAVEVPDPTGYGRIVMGPNRKVSGIVEEADASEAEKEICTVNAGIYCINRVFLQNALEKLRTNNAQGEFYLTDIVGIAHEQTRPVGVVLGGDPIEVAGVNSRSDLEAVQTALQERSRKIS
jgi:bifunctional UDP-N-acetylglucosamine pyrophosphorylase/glucosamine-1-phosphate N-acetyltransferase/UDP-N-acetylglucosamine pyrophosphorylase